MTDSNGAALVRRADRVVRAASPFGGARDTFNDAQRMALALADSTMIPGAFRGNVANVLVALEYAHRLQCSVLAVMQNMFVIEGRPGLASSFLIALINASGKFTALEWDWQGEPGNDSWGCRAVAVRRDGGKVCTGPLLTIDHAKREGWYARRGSKWQTIPEQMLPYRSATFWARLHAPELMLGMHTSDEIEDIGAPVHVQISDVARALDTDDEPEELPELEDQPEDEPDELFDAQEPEEPEPPEPEQASALAKLMDELTEVVGSMKPKGGDATRPQRDRIIEAAARITEPEGFLHAGLVHLANSPDLGRTQAGMIVGRLKSILELMAGQGTIL